MARSTRPRKVQDAILLHLASQEPPSIAALSREVGTSRPSASRAVGQLRLHGLIEADALQLTPDGHSIAVALRTTARFLSSSALESVARSLELQRSLIPTITPQQLDELIQPTRRILEQINMTAFADLQRAVESQHASIAKTFDSQTRKMLQGSVASLLAAHTEALSLSTDMTQGLNASILKLGAAASTQMPDLARKMSDITDAVEKAHFPRAYETLLPGLASLGPSLNEYIMDFKRSIPRVTADIGVIPMRSWEPLLPVSLTSEIVDSAASIAGPPTGEESRSSDDAIDSRNVALRAALLPLPERFIVMWDGSWVALDSGAPDHLRQAMHSARELLNQVLTHVAPDSAFSEEELAQRGSNGRPTRKMRIRKVTARDGIANWADSFATTVDLSYGVLAAESHMRDRERPLTLNEARGFLISVGGLLLVLLDVRQPPRD